MSPKAQSYDRDTVVAIAAIVIAVFFLSLSDAVIKLTGAHLPLWQMYILRSLLALPILIVIALFKRPIRRGPMFWVWVRSAILVVMWLIYYIALPSMALSLAAAAYYTAPLFIVFFTALLARQWPSLRVLGAILLGFVGVLMILRPESSSFDAITLLPILSAALYAIAMIITATKCLDSDPLVLAVALNIAFVVAGAVLSLWSGVNDSYLLGPWAALNIELVSTIVVLALTGVIGSIGAAIAYQKGPPVTIAAFDYSYLIFSLIFGVLIFSELPNWIALCGVAAILLAGLLSLPRQS